MEKIFSRRVSYLQTPVDILLWQSSWKMHGFIEVWCVHAMKEFPTQCLLQDGTEVEELPELFLLYLVLGRRINISTSCSCRIFLLDF